MALVAGTLITTAEQKTYSSIGVQKLSKPALLAELSQQDQLVVQLIAQNAPDMFATTTGVLIVSDAGNTNGYTLQQGIHYRDFTHIDTAQDRYVPINLLQRQHRDSGSAAPAGMLRTGASAGVFSPIDPLNKRWTGTDKREWFEADSAHEITYSYVPLPQPLTSLTSTLTSPDMAREVFISSLEAAIIAANPPTNEVEVAVWQVKLQAAMAIRQAALGSLLWQLYKFAAPQGQPADSAWESASEWVQRQIRD